MDIVNRTVFQIAVCTHAVNHHVVTRVQLTFEFYLIEAKPDKRIGDKAYNCNDLDDDFYKQETDRIAPYKINRKKNPTQDDRNLRHY